MAASRTFLGRFRRRVPKKRRQPRIGASQIRIDNRARATTSSGNQPPLPSPTFPRKFADVDWGSRKINPIKYVRSAGLELPSDPIGCSPRGSAMKRPLYYLLCAIACTSMVGATLPMAAIAEAMQPQETAGQQAQADATSSDTGKAEDGTNTNATADTVEDGTATSTGTSAVNTERADGATAAATTVTTAPPHPLAPKPTPRPPQSPPRHKPATPTQQRQPKTASPSPSRGTTPPRAPRRPSM